MKTNSKQTAFQFGIVLLIIIAVNIIAGLYPTALDLTEEKRYTLTPATTDLLQGLDDIITVEVLLEGDFTAGFKRLQNEVKAMLEDFGAESPYLEYYFESPIEGKPEFVQERQRALAQKGIVPINLRLGDAQSRSEQIIYPYAIFRKGDRSIAVNILESEQIGVDPEQVLNNSISLLEYKFASALQKVSTISLARPVIGFTAGHGEIEPPFTESLEKALSPFYQIARFDIKDALRIPPDTINLLIVAQPREAFDDKDKFKLDQYVMNGGKMIWLIDRLGVSWDSLARKGEFVPNELDLNLDDLFFKYGLRIKPNMVLDLEVTPVPLVVGQVGGRSQLDLFPNYYHPAVVPRSNHAIVKGLDRISFRFANTIELLPEREALKATPLLTTSPYSRVQFLGSRVFVESFREKPDVSKFNKPHQLLAVLMEGEFESLYKNRIPAEAQEGLRQVGIQVRDKSVPTKMIFIADGDVIANPIDRKTGTALPLGYNRYDGYTYANRELMLNAIEYLMDDQGVFEARAKEVKLRLLNQVKAQEEKGKWQFINIGVPVLLLSLFGVSFHYWRRRKYEKQLVVGSRQ